MKIKTFKPTKEDIEKEWDKTNFDKLIQETIDFNFDLGYNKALEKVEKMIDEKFTPQLFEIYCDFESWLKEDIRELKKQLQELKKESSK